MIPVYCSSSLEGQIARWEILRWTRWISSCAYINTVNILQTWKTKHAEGISYNLTPYTFYSLFDVVYFVRLSTLYHQACNVCFCQAFFISNLSQIHGIIHGTKTEGIASPSEVSMVRYNEQKSPRKLKSNSDFWEAGTISQKGTIYVVHFVDSDDVKKNSPPKWWEKWWCVCLKKSRKEDPLPSLAKFPSLPSTTLPETIGEFFAKNRLWDKGLTVLFGSFCPIFKRQW